MYNPKISIIIPVYNVKPYLKQALDSVINQTLKEIEIICVDDCSNDGSLDILKEYANKDDRLKLIELKENKGQGNARNIAIDIATGDYVMFLDPDDWYELNACEIAYKQISNNGNDFVMFGFKQYHEDTKHSEVMLYWLEPFKSVIYQPNIKILELDTIYMKNAFSVCRIYNRQFLNKFNIRYSNDRIDQDNIFVVNAFISTNNISIISIPLYNYRINNKSTSFKTKLWKGMIDARKRSYELIKDRNADQKYMNVFLVYCISALIHWYNKFSKLDKDIEKNLYKEIRKFFKLINEEQDIELIKNKIDYCQYKSILYSNYFQYSFFNYLKLFLQLLFSIKNENILGNKYKIITILGIKFKFSTDEIVMHRYENVLKRIRCKIKKKEKINIVFLSNECEKWSYDLLYDEFKNNKNFNVRVLISPLFRDIEQKNIDKSLKKQFEFYKSKNINVELGFVNNKYINLKRIGADIIFYQQPYSIPKQYFPSKVSKYALTFYSPYGYETFNYDANYTRWFHRFLFKYFIEHDLNAKRYETYNTGNSLNCVTVGYPKLDCYLSNNEIRLTDYWAEPNKIKIIYAPHHSFGINSTTNIGTFPENGKFILEFAKKHPETTWLFKPHPKLPNSLVYENGLMTKEEVNSYYNEWRKIGTVYELGDYFDIFKSSDLMITDCASFLAEYLPSKHPLIRLNKKNSIEMSDLGNRIISQYYIVNNTEEFINVFEELVKNKNDYKREAREKIIAEIIDFNESSSKKIYNYVLKMLNNE